MQKLLSEMSGIFVNRVIKPQMRHDSTKTAADYVPIPDDLAPVPVTVPELPDVISPRPGFISEMRSSILGFMSSGTVSLSSVKTSNKDALTGQGGTFSIHREVYFV